MRTMTTPSISSTSTRSSTVCGCCCCYTATAEWWYLLINSLQCSLVVPYIKNSADDFQCCGRKVLLSSHIIVIDAIMSV